MAARRALVMATLVVAAGASILGKNADSQDDDQYALPEGMLIGAGVSAMQTEGAWNLSGKAESQADFLFHLDTSPFPVSPDVAADSYHRYKEDVAKAKQLKLQMYRLSLSWSRLLPTADASRPNEEGVYYYHAFIDEIIANGMEPLVTLYHFDHPQVLQKEFLGWESTKMVDKFTEYADFAFKAYGGKVKLWATINEPNFYCMYFNSMFVVSGEVAMKDVDVQRCMHHFTLAHMKAYRLYKANYFSEQKGKVGTTAVLFPAKPETTSQEDIYAADAFNEVNAGRVLHPVVYGDYSDLLKSLTHSVLPTFSDDEKKLLKGAADFIGINVYNGVTVSYTTEKQNASYGPIFGSVLDDLDFVKVDASFGMDFSKINPDVMHNGLLWTWQRYKLPIVVAENGYGGKSTQGVHDHDRAVYHSAYLRSLVTTVRKYNVNVLAYCAWSLIDCFEWTSGYSRPFGLVHVDYEGKSLNRTLKDSSTFFIELAEKRVVPFVSSAMLQSASAPAAVLAALVLAAQGWATRLW